MKLPRTLPRQVIYLLVAVAVIVPLLTWRRMPVKPSPEVKALYDTLEGLQPGSPVLLSFDYDPTSKEELYPMSTALLRHCFRRGLHPVVMTHWISNIDLCRKLIDETAGEAEKESGRDYVFLGWRPGGGQLILNMGENFKAAFDRDIDKKPTEGMPALAGVYSLRDIPLVVGIAAGGTTEMWIAYGADRFKFKLGAGCTAVIAPDLYPYLQSEQLVGMAAGLRGAADYEVLLGRHGQAYAGMPAQSIAHLLIIALILGANLHFLLRRKTRKG